MLGQASGCGGDCISGCGDKGLVQSLMPLKTTRDLLEDGEREGTASSGVEVEGESSS